MAIALEKLQLEKQKLDKKQLDKLKSEWDQSKVKLEALTAKYKPIKINADSSAEDFQKHLVGYLESAYETSKKLADDAAKASWTDTVLQVAKDIAKLTSGTALASGTAYTVACLLGKKKEAADVAAGTGLGAGLLLLWGIGKEHLNSKQAIEHAQSFLAIAQDLQGDKQLIRERFQAVAYQLFQRFKWAVYCLHNGNEGTKELALFFATAIIRDFTLKRVKCSAEQIVGKIINHCAVPPEKDAIYKGTWGRIHLRTKHGAIKKKNQNWTIEGILLRSPIYNTYNNKYYVRDGKLGKENRADKYPVQIVNYRPEGFTELVKGNREGDAITETIDKRRKTLKVIDYQERIEKLEASIEICKNKMLLQNGGDIKVQADSKLKEDTEKKSRPLYPVSISQAQAQPQAQVHSQAQCQSLAINISPENVDVVSQPTEDNHEIEKERQIFLEQMKNLREKAEVDAKTIKAEAYKIAKKKNESSVLWQAKKSGASFGFLEATIDGNILKSKAEIEKDRRDILAQQEEEKKKAIEEANQKAEKEACKKAKQHQESSIFWSSMVAGATFGLVDFSSTNVKGKGGLHNG